MTLIGGAKDLESPWKATKIEGVPAVLFDTRRFRSCAYSKALQADMSAARFYRRHLSELITSRNFGCILYYGELYGTGAAIAQQCRQRCIPLVADMVEWFGWSWWYALNGLNIQQARFLHSISSMASGIIGISHFWLKWAAQRNLPAVWIPSFGEDGGLYRREPESNEAPFLIRFMGHWIERELPLTILQAIGRCLKRRLNVRLEILGDVGKHPRERQALRVLANDKELLARTQFRGWVNDSTRAELLASADAFVLLRPANRETDCLFPARLPEYLLSGNPVILSKTGSFPELFRHRRDVWFVSAENHPGEVADGIMHLATHRGDCFAIGQRGRATALSQFSLSTLGERLARFLEEIVGRRQPHFAASRLGQPVLNR